MKLNNQQIKAINHIDGPAFVTSCPGSGKTTVITERVANLINNKGIIPQNLLCLTFTNKAAKEMRERIVEKVGLHKSKFFIGTFHSLCASILRRYGSKIGYSDNYTIFDQKNQEDMIVSIGKSLGYVKKSDIKYYHIMNSVNHWRENLESEQDLLDRFDDAIDCKIAQTYLEEIKKQNIIDFSGLLYETVKLFEADPVLLKKFQTKMKYILVDECQDTNYIQFYLVKSVGDKYKNIFITGDISQSVYRFRNARYQNILDFLRDYPDCKKIPLEKNYRSTPEIVACSDKLIKHNSTHMGGDMETDNISGSPVSCEVYYEPYEEAMGIAHKIKEIVEDYGWEYSDCAVLYRLNRLSLELQTSFSHVGIPFVVIGGPSFFDRREIRDCLSMLKFISNPGDLLAFDRVASLFNGVGAVTISKMEKLAEANDLDVLQLCRRIENYDVSRTINNTALKIRDAFDFDYHQTHAGDCLSRITEKLGYNDILTNNSPEDHQDRIDNVKELIDSATSFGEKNKSLEKYLQNIALISSADKENEENFVTLQSIHSAKGTESEIIFLPGVEQNILPHSRALLESDDYQEAEAEERRIAYVAMTRAKKNLFISYNKTRKYRDKSGVMQSRHVDPSQFLYEAGLLEK